MKKPIRSIAIAAATLAAAVVVVIIGMHRSPNLLDKSTLVVDVAGWWIEEPITECPYEWLGQDTLFSHSGWWRLQKPFTYNVRTHNRLPLAALEKLMSAEEPSTKSWELSPDGTQLLWNIDCYDTVHTATLDGKNHRSWEIANKSHGDTVGSAYWLSEGKRWVASMINYTDAASTGAFTASIADKVGAPAKWLPENVANSQLALDQHIKCENGECSVVDVHETTNRVKWRLLAHAPEDTTDEPAIDRGRTRIAWLAHGAVVPIWSRCLHYLRLDRFARLKRHTLLYTSNYDGSNPVEVGRMETMVTSQEDDAVAPRFIRWTTDGKGISYVYNDRLYVLPVGGRY